MASQWNQQREWELAKVRMLMDDFDRDIFLDETGDFKSTNPDVKAVIQCDDANHLGNAAQKQQHDNLETIHGFNTEDLIELQNIKLIDDIPKPSEIQVDKNTVSSNIRPTGPQPRNEERMSRPADTYREHKYHAKNFRGAGQPTRQPLQQQRIPQAQGLISRPPPPFQVPYWSPTRPPPPFCNRSQFPAAPPLVNPNLGYRYPHRGSFQNGPVSTRAVNPQNFQRASRPNGQRFHSATKSFHSTNEFQKYK
ncbi:unnamed protein product [Candidula unifasciata]|uniref:Uncharacterized protein n=1 Tax=Candidula unifasciata TaxID=100452 RepID=A0A8S3ZZB6_9EUPU|nr:unnamed protein product [Candidula unifasciata]